MSPGTVSAVAGYGEPYRVTATHVRILTVGKWPVSAMPRLQWVDINGQTLHCAHRK